MGAFLAKLRRLQPGSQGGGRHERGSAGEALVKIKPTVSLEGAEQLLAFVGLRIQVLVCFCTYHPQFFNLTTKHVF